MNIGKMVQSEFSEKSETTFRFVSGNIIAVIMLVSQILVVILSARDSVFPEAEIFLSIVGTCAQIIAGLYGITMAGYTFFLSRIDGLCVSDMTLDYVVASIKKRFKLLIWFITLNVLMNLVISIVLMYSPIPEQGEHAFWYRLFCNEFLVSTLGSIVLILYYSVLVIDPNCLEKEAKKLKKKLGGRSIVPGSAVEFIALYDQIEERCASLLPEKVLGQIRENKGKHFEYTIALLQEKYVTLRPVIGDLNRIHRYYECVVNCTPLGVNQEMCQLAGRVLSFLDQFAARHAGSRIQNRD